MKNILYIGNNLTSKTTNVSSIQTLGALFEKEGIVVKYASSKTNKVLRLLDMLWTCFKLHKKVSLVLIDTYSTQNFYYALMVSQLCRVLHLDYIPILHGGNLPSRLKRNPKLSQLIFNNARCNVSPSLYLKEIFKTNSYFKTVHIPNSIEIQNYPKEAKTYETPKLLWVRSFSKIYNPQMAVKVLKSLKKDYPNAKLCMVGPDGDGTLDKVKALAEELKLEVKFTGKLEKSQWIDLSKNYNIFINTTNFDNSPVSVIEAMALGFPIVSTNVGGMSYLIENEVDGLLVSADKVDEMCAAIHSLIQNSNKREWLLKNAREKVIKFDWAQVKLLWLNALKPNKDES